MEERSPRTIGVIGEELAFHYLVSRGYKVLLRNYESPLGEIDLIAKENGELVFLEVKTRSSEAMGDPSESVTFRERRQIVKSAKYYIRRYGIEHVACRFDVVSILLPLGGDPRIEIIRDAFGEGQ